MSDEPDEEYGLLVPFIVCQSQGGPLDDESFTIGFELGSLDGELAICENIIAQPNPRYVHAAGIKQLDLLAMRRGFMLRQAEPDEAGEWIYVEFERQENVNG